jgi:hypothetical protein
MNPLAASQVALNKETLGDWDVFAAHRRRLMGLLNKERPPAGSRQRLCVLGAGNCNDLDLALLRQRYAQIDLLDLDGAALSAGVGRQGFSQAPALNLHGNVDLSGLLDRMAGWSAHTVIADAELEACRTEPTRTIGCLLPDASFDAVVSTCLLSQLIDSVVDAVGIGHSRVHDLVAAVRAGHLRLLMHLLAPGGHGFLVTDLVSSDTAPMLASVPQEGVPALTAQLIAAGNHFLGVAPAQLTAALQTDPMLVAQLRELDYARPWLWTLGPRLYAVYAIRMQKRPAT